MSLCFRCMYTPTECIRESLLCNGEPDCPHGEDESSCNSECFAHDKYVCSSSPFMCIDIKQKCDGVKDCGEGEDERDCSNNIWILAVVVLLILILILGLWCRYRKTCDRFRMRSGQQNASGNTTSLGSTAPLNSSSSPDINQPPSYEVVMGLENRAFDGEPASSAGGVDVPLPPPPAYSSVAHILPSPPPKQRSYTNQGHDQTPVDTVQPSLENNSIDHTQNSVVNRPTFQENQNTSPDSQDSVSNDQTGSSSRSTDVCHGQDIDRDTETNEDRVLSTGVAIPYQQVH